MFNFVICHPDYCGCWRRSIVNFFNFMWVWSNTLAGEHKSKESKAGFVKFTLVFVESQIDICKLVKHCI